MPHEISPARLAANRANAQRSTGPRTEEGKAASSKNAFKHGITARCVLDGEVKEDLDILLKDYNDRLRPVDGLEEQLVFNMVMLEWQIRRIRIIETSLFELELADPNLAGGNAGTGIYRQAKAFESLANKGPIQLANRVLTRMSRELANMKKDFYQLRKNCPSPATPPAPEPPTALPPAPALPSTPQVQNEPNASISAMESKEEMNLTPTST